MQIYIYIGNRKLLGILPHKGWQIIADIVQADAKL